MFRSHQSVLYKPLPQENCDLCGNQRWTPENKPCKCKLRRDIENYLADLGQYYTLVKTPLLAHLLSHNSIVVECEAQQVFLAHLRTALIQRINNLRDQTPYTSSWRWMVANPNEVMSLTTNFNNEPYEVNLLVISMLGRTDSKVINFPAYEKAEVWLSQLVASRGGAQLPTWFVLQSRSELFQHRFVAGSNFEKQLRPLECVQLSSKEAQLLMKNSNREKSRNNFERGLGLAGVFPNLLKL